MKGRAGSVAEISVSGLEILPYEYFSPVTGMKKREELWRSGYHRLALPAVFS